MNDSTDPGRTDEGFDDPTAPSWTSPDPAPPARPSPAEPAVTPPSPYVEQPYGQTPYGQQPDGYTAYGQPASPMPPAPYGAPPRNNTSAIVLTTVSAVALVACCNVLAIPSLVLGILGLNRNTTDPQGAARLAKVGWITFTVTTALVVIGWVVFFALAVSGLFDGSATSEYQGL